MTSIKGRRKFVVQPQNVDFMGHLTLFSIGNMLLDTSDENADENGFGLRHLYEMNAAWVLSRLAIEIERYPNQYDQLEVETWVSSVSRIISNRNFCIKDIKGDVIGNASSCWAMIDMASRRPVDLEKSHSIHDFICDEPSLIQEPMKLLPITGKLIDSFRVKYSDVDINGHVNSIRYIQWISDCFSLEEYRAKRVKRFDINYISEINYGDTIEIYREELTQGDFRFDVRKGEKVSARARITLL